MHLMIIFFFLIYTHLAVTYWNSYPISATWIKKVMATAHMSTAEAPVQIPMMIKVSEEWRTSCQSDRIEEREAARR
jgi:hypothetical protein